MKVGNENTKGSRATDRGFAPWLILWQIFQIPGFQDYLSQDYHDSSKHSIEQVKYLDATARKGENRFE